jgi:ubiquinone/menaquinone biosynthesis C-methylase UbiE
MRRALIVPILMLAACKDAPESQPPGSGNDADGHSHDGSHDGSQGDDHDGHRAHGHHEGGAEAKGHVHHGGHHRFEDAEQWAKVFDDPARDAWQRPDEVVEWVGLPREGVIADIGAGTGYFAVRFAAAEPGARIIGSDVEASMVDYMRKRAGSEGIENLVAVQGSATDPGIDRAIDVAFMCDVIHHIGDRQAYLGKLRESLAAGGRVIIVDFKKDAGADAPGPPAAMRIRAEDLIAEFEKAGYRLLRRDGELLEHQYLLEFAAMQ